jgi:hypothetical protein
MRTNKLLFGALAMIALVLASCSAASLSSGSYNGTFSAYNWTSSSGSATAKVTTVNDNTVNVTITANGTTFTFENVGVTKFDVAGVVQVTFTASNSDASFSGYYQQVSGINQASLEIDSTASPYGYVHFSGSK